MNSAEEERIQRLRVAWSTNKMAKTCAKCGEVRHMTFGTCTCPREVSAKQKAARVRAAAPVQVEVNPYTLHHTPENLDPTP